ncbi:hypothetical protein [Paracoccus sulfuroxidans]|uniref:Uncharacterized protein n=1 Tax=Paracoccus sulfuroxidans TaxID=384678 RepID=A0A562NS80_9RHOB|nr:hypothetical protein [Paracoccus sulfuroxidans]TWI34920.1 hypothetical protein IQ24_01428 [Paracoccus sulfuroxidans]
MSVYDKSRAILFTGGTLPVGGVSAGDLGAETSRATQAESRLGAKIDGLSVNGAAGFKGPYLSISSGMAGTIAGQVFTVTQPDGMLVVSNDGAGHTVLTSLVSAEIANQSKQPPYQPYASYAAAEAASIPASVDMVEALEAGAVIGWVRDSEGTALGGGWSPAGTPTPKHWGAVADGVTDDRAAFEAVEGDGVSPVKVTGSHFLSSNTAAQNVAYILSSDASVTMGAGGWNPRRYYKDGVTPFDRKVNFSTQNPTVPPGAYTILSDGYQSEMYWINQWGYQEKDTNGNHSGAFQGPWPAGQTRGARTGAHQLYLRGQHSGMGDGYNLFGSMTVAPHGDGPITYWSGQNSGGFGNFQVNAQGAKVNLYGLGDCVLDDKGFADVSLLGHVSIVKRFGLDSGDYEVPRFNFLAISDGDKPLDHAYATKGAYRHGLDLANSTFVNNCAIALGEGHRIGFDAQPPLPGKYTSSTGGTTYVHKAVGPNRLEFVMEATPILNLYSDRLEVKPAAENNAGLRVRGASATAMAAIGQIGNTSYVSAHTTGSETTVLALRAADSTGAEQSVLLLRGSGVVAAPLLPTFAGNASAKAAGRTAGDIYKTDIGELRIVV